MLVVGDDAKGGRWVLGLAAVGAYWVLRPAAVDGCAPTVLPCFSAVQMLGLAVELLNSSPADDVETRYRCGGLGGGACSPPCSPA